MESSVVKWRFNAGAWSSAIRDAVERSDVETVAIVCNVDITTIGGWSKMYKSSWGKYPYPSMTSFVTVVRELDLDPRDFWELDL